VTPDQLEQFRATLVRGGIRPTVSDLVRASDAARVLGLAPKTLRNWRSDGRGPDFVSIGGSVFYPLASLNAFIEAGRCRPVRPGTPPRVLDRNQLTGNDAPVKQLSRLETRLPAPVASAIRELARAQGVPTSELLAEALRSFPPVAAAVEADETIIGKRDEPQAS
jgi:hypothetical protein